MKATYCTWCGERFTCDDPAANATGTLHIDCLLRTLVGGLNHQCGMCPCHGGEEPADPPAMTRREAAKAAAFYFRMSTPVHHEQQAAE